MHSDPQSTRRRTFAPPIYHAEARYNAIEELPAAGNASSTPRFWMRWLSRAERRMSVMNAFAVLDALFRRPWEGRRPRSLPARQFRARYRSQHCAAEHGHGHVLPVAVE